MKRDYTGFILFGLSITLAVYVIGCGSKAPVPIDDGIKEIEEYEKETEEISEIKDEKERLEKIAKSIDFEFAEESPCDYFTVGIWPDGRGCLWNIAGLHKVYNDPWKWRRIFEANLDIINDPNLVYPKQRLKIPRQ